MGQLESLRELNIQESKIKERRKNKIMPLLFMLIGISLKHEMLKHCTLKLFGSFIVLC
jgi:hypothetical protein